MSQRSIFVLGETGSGKSTLCKLLTRDSPKFIVSDSSAGATLEVTSQRIDFDGYNNTGDYVIYDTPGLNDEKRDVQHIREMHAKLSKISACSGFLLVTNGNPRLTASQKHTIGYFRDIFGPKIIENLAIVVSRVSYNTYENNDPSSQSRNWAEAVQELFKSVGGVIPIFYFASFAPGAKANTNPDEMSFRQQQLTGIMTFVESKVPIDCRGARLVPTEGQKNEDAINKEKKRTEKAEADRKRLEETNTALAERLNLNEQQRQEAERRFTEMMKKNENQAEKHQEEIEKLKRDIAKAEQRGPRQNSGQDAGVMQMMMALLMSSLGPRQQAPPQAMGTPLLFMGEPHGGGGYSHAPPANTKPRKTTRSKNSPKK